MRASKPRPTPKRSVAVIETDTMGLPAADSLVGSSDMNNYSSARYTDAGPMPSSFATAEAPLPLQFAHLARVNARRTALVIGINDHNNSLDEQPSGINDQDTPTRAGLGGDLRRGG